MRVTVNNDAAAQGVAPMVEQLADMGINVPIIGDFHYNGHILLKKYPECARALAKYRINPGNVSIGRKDDDNFRTMIEVAVENQQPVRIGVNWGSLDQQLLTRMMDENSKRSVPLEARDVMMEAMMVSALHSAELAEKYGLRPDQIILSAKVSGVQDLVDAYRELAKRCEYPLHLGLTEAGHGRERNRVQHGRTCDSYCRKVSATPSAFRSRRHRMAIARKKFWSRNRSCNRSACAVSFRRSRRARAADARHPPSSRNWQNRFRTTCASRCRCGRRSTRRRRNEAGRDGLHRERPRRIEARQHRHLVAGHF